MEEKGRLTEKTDHTLLNVLSLMRRSGSSMDVKQRSDSEQQNVLHPWPYLRNVVGSKKQFLVNALSFWHSSTGRKVLQRFSLYFYI